MREAHHDPARKDHAAAGYLLQHLAQHVDREQHLRLVAPRVPREQQMKIGDEATWLLGFGSESGNDDALEKGDEVSAVLVIAAPLATLGHAEEIVVAENR